MEYDNEGRPKYDKEGNRIFYPKIFMSASNMSKKEKEELQKKLTPLEYNLKRENLAKSESELRAKRHKQEIITTPPRSPISPEKLLNEPLNDFPVYRGENDSEYEFSQSIFDSPGKSNNHTSLDESKIDLSLFENKLGGRKSKKTRKSKKSKKTRKSKKSKKTRKSRRH